MWNCLRIGNKKKDGKMSALTVYKASAGSGKTFTLAAEYIKFLVRNPWDYNGILAVTFTNKATDEMKTRILGQLFGISRSLPESKPYLDKVTAETGVGEEEARKNAAVALSLLVHNYDYFHVQTIDTFFQGVLRNLAKELDLSANLRIELNDKKVETLAVDALIDELDRKSALFSWLMRFVMENIDENKGWNVVRSVRDFGEKIFDDEYRKNCAALNSRLREEGFYDRFTKQLLCMKKERSGALKKIEEDFFSALGESGTDMSTIKGGKQIASYFNKLANGKLTDKDCLTKTFAGLLEDSGSWVKKSDRNRDALLALVEERLMPLLGKSETLRREALKTVVSVEATLQNLRGMLLLDDIEKKVREMNAQANRFLLSDTQYLLHKMMSGTDTPFIFEKMGARLKHIMIDEFQDTSTVQWQNFKILLAECMSHSGGSQVNNLIVGDVKQSIYRWRAGDWQLLQNIEGEFGKSQTDIHTLDTNYRSARNVVTFNNLFFGMSAELETEREKSNDPSLAERIREAYEDAGQKIKKENTTGLVQVKLKPAGEDYVSDTIQEIERIIDRLLQKSVKQKDIAILMRSKRNIPVIANYFTENRPDIKIISNEAFRLDHSVAVNTIVAALRTLYAPADKITKACLVKYYRQHIMGECPDDMDALREETADKYLPEEFVNGAEELKKMPLYDLAEKIYKIFGIDKLQGDGAYVCAFFDSLSAYINDMSADVPGFLEEWDENIHSNKIQTDGAGGIQIMSIHASKGLEFDNVIIPFCDWKLELFQNNYFWAHPSEAPYDALPVLSVRYAANLAESVYSEDYRNEHMQNTMDNLNLLYVAFTRAGKNLFVIGKKNSSGSRSMLVQNCLGILSEKLEGAVIEEEDGGEGDIVFSYGEFAGREEAKKEKSENVFLQVASECPVSVASEDVTAVFRQSNKSRDFVEGVSGDDKPADNSYVKIGNILHLVFSNIRTAEDIAPVLDRYEAEGILYGEGLDRGKIQSLLYDSLSVNGTVADWFSGHWSLYNECSILCVDKKTGAVETRRPDRVMKDGDRIVVVDFKFGKMRDIYKVQVAEYMDLMRRMGYTDVSGYIWLVNEKKTVEVKNS